MTETSLSSAPEAPASDVEESYVVELPPESVKLRTRNLSFFYGKSQALFDLDIAIPKKSVTALIGPSGCGKSTLLRTFNRMYDLYPGQKATGEILLDDRNILAETDIARLRSRVGMVFQKPTPFPMSIYDNVAFGVKLYHNKPKSELDGVVESALRRAALWDEVKDKLQTSGLGLSGGQQQRLCVARGIAVEPEVLLLDEPASALDPISTAKLEETISELKRDFTIVIVTHNMGQAGRISDNTGFMYLGRLVEFCPTSEMFLKPRAKRTQDYISGRFG